MKAEWKIGTGEMEFIEKSSKKPYGPCHAKGSLLKALAIVIPKEASILNPCQIVM